MKTSELRKEMWQEQLNSMSVESLRKALKKREKHIEGKITYRETQVIKLKKGMYYRCIECDNKGFETDGEGYFLQIKLSSASDVWFDVTDLTELKVWEYNKLVDELNKHYPDYPIEHLEGRFV